MAKAKKGDGELVFNRHLLCVWQVVGEYWVVRKIINHLVKGGGCDSKVQSEIIRIVEFVGLENVMHLGKCAVLFA